LIREFLYRRKTMRSDLPRPARSSAADAPM
jgi:hypothetical protein